MVQPNFAKLVYDDSCIGEVGFTEQVRKERGLSASEKARQQDNRNF